MFFFISLKNRINNKKDTHNKIYTTIESSKYKKMIYNLISGSSRYEFCDHVIFRKLKKQKKQLKVVRGEEGISLVSMLRIGFQLSNDAYGYYT